MVIIVAMATTIALPETLRDQLKEFGDKGETYADIIARLIKSAKERQLHDLLFDTRNTTPVREALKEAERRWPS